MFSENGAFNAFGNLFCDELGRLVCLQKHQTVLIAFFKGWHVFFPFEEPRLYVQSLILRALSESHLDGLGKVLRREGVVADSCDWVNTSAVEPLDALCFLLIEDGYQTGFNIH